MKFCLTFGRRRRITPPNDDDDNRKLLPFDRNWRVFRGHVAKSTETGSRGGSRAAFFERVFLRRRLPIAARRRRVVTRRARARFGNVAPAAELRAGREEEEGSGRAAAG